MATEPLANDHHYMVISSDNHAGANLLGYKHYLEAKWHDEFDAWAAAYENPWDFVDPRLGQEGFDADATEILTGAASWHSPLNWDSDKRLRHMEADGVVAEVIFPTTSGAGRDCKPITAGSSISAGRRKGVVPASRRSCCMTSMTPSPRFGA
jgi:hypothetical protein